MRFLNVRNLTKWGCKQCFPVPFPVSVMVSGGGGCEYKFLGEKEGCECKFLETKINKTGSEAAVFDF